MSWLMQGFLIAIWAVLTMIFVRLGIIEDELRRRKGKKQHKSCATCVYADILAFDPPCSVCIHSGDRPHYEENENADT